MKRSSQSFLGAASAAVLALLSAPDAQADVLIMKDGRIFEGFTLEEKDDLVEVTLKAGKIEVTKDLVEIVLKDGQEITFNPLTDEEKAKFAKGFVRIDGRWQKIKNAKRIIEKSLEQRLEQAKEDLKHDEWMNCYTTETKHFVWKHTTPMSTTKRFIDSADAYYDVFKKDWGIKRNKRKPKLTINFFTDRSEFRQVSGAGGGALAYFMFLGDYDMCAFYDRLDADFTEQVVFHELGHYLHKLIDEDFKYPHWPGESLSEYYGGAKFDQDSGKLEVGLIHNGRLATIKGEMERGDKIELEKMITTKGFEDYTWGWSFVHFLMNDKTHKKNFKKFFIGLATDKKVFRERGMANLKFVDGKEVLRYFMETMKIEDMDALRELEMEWYDYINEELTFTGENALIWEAKTAKSLGEQKRARELYEKAFEKNFDGAPASAHFDYYRMLNDRSGSDAIKHLEAAVKKAPMTAIFRYTLGDVLRDKKGKKQELGEFHVAIAKELDPDVDRNALRISFD